MLFFCDFGMTSKRIVESAKKLFKREELCYSVVEASEADTVCFPGFVVTGANGRKELKDQGFNLRWRYIATNELLADMYSGGEVGLVSVFSVCIADDYMGSNQFRKIVHN